MIKELRNIITKGLYNHLKTPIIPVDDVQEKEPYPYITYNIISPYNSFNGMGNYAEEFVSSNDDRFEFDVEETLELQPTMTISFNCYSNNRQNNGFDGKGEALELALNIKNWFKHIGYQYLDDNNLVCVDVLALGDRTTLIVDNYEARYGLDVVIRFNDKIKRRYETIEEFNINTEIE